MERKYKTATMLNFGVDANQISQQAANGAGVDLTGSFNKIMNVVQKKLDDKTQIAVRDNEYAVSAAMDDAEMVFSDKALYKDPEKLKQKKEEFKKAYAKAYDGAMDISLSETERTGLYQHYDKMKRKLDNKIALNEKAQEFTDQQQDVNLKVSQLGNTILSSAYSGNSAYIDDNFSLLEKTIKGQVDKGLISPEKSEEFLSKTIANATVIAVSKNDIDKIKNSKLTDDQKVAQLKQLKSKIYDDDYIKKLSVETARGTSLSKESVEMSLRNNIGNIEKITNMAINHLTSSNKSETLETKNVNKAYNNLTQKKKNEYDNLSNGGKKYEAYTLLTNASNQVSEFNTIDDFTNNEQVQEKYYGKKFKLKDLNDSTVPTNVLPEGTVKSIASIGTDPLNQLSVSSQQFNSLSQNEVLKLVYDKTINLVKTSTGTSDKVTAMKYLLGQDMSPIQIVQNGRRLSLDIGDMATMKAMTDENTSEEAVADLLEENIINTNISSVVGANNNYLGIASGKQEKKDALRIQYGNLGIALSENTINDNYDENFEVKDFQVKGKNTSAIAKYSAEIFNSMYPEADKIAETKYTVNVIKELTRSSSSREELYNYAITFYNTGGYVSEEDIADGISNKNLTRKKINGVSAMDKAVKLWLRKINGHNSVGSKEKNPIK